MSTWAGLVGVGRAMERDLDARDRRKHEEEQFSREQERAARSSYASFFEDVIKNPEKWPQGSDQAATRMFLQIVGDRNLKLKDVQNMHNEFVQSTARERALSKLGLKPSAPQMPSSAATTMPGVPGMPGVGVGAGVVNAVAPEPQQSMQQTQETVPNRTVTGPLTPEELDEREIQSYTRRLEAQKQIEAHYRRPNYIEVEPGKVLIDPETGKQIAGPPGVPKRDYSVTPFEVLIDPNSTPEQKRVAQETLTKMHTNQGDQFRPTSGGAGKPPNPYVGGQYIQQPDGSFGFVFPRILAENPADPKAVVSLPSGVQKPESAAARDKKAQLQLMLNDVTLLQQTAPKLKDYIGRIDGAMVGAKEWLGIGNKPEVADLYATSDNLASILINARSGAAVSPAEFARLERFLPNPRKTETTFEVQLQRFRRELEFVLEKRYGMNGVGDAIAFPGDVGSTPLQRMTGVPSRSSSPARPAARSIPRTATPTTVTPGTAPAPPPGFKPVH